MDPLTNDGPLPYEATGEGPIDLSTRAETISTSCRVSSARMLIRTESRDTPLSIQTLAWLWHWHP